MDGGKFLVIAGVFLIISGLLIILFAKVPFLGRLPGDIFIQKGGFRFIFPIATSLVISLLLTVAVNFILRLFR